MGTRDFQNGPLRERWACFYVTISERFQCFQYFSILGTNFRKSKKLSQKSGVPFLS